MSTEEITTLSSFKKEISAYENDFLKALPRNIPVDRFIRTIVTTVNLNPYLLTLDRKSLILACMKSAQNGLLMDGKEAAAVPFKKEVVFIPMKQGLLKMMRNSGVLQSITYGIVYTKDKWEYQKGDDEKIVHAPFEGEYRGDRRLAYAIFHTKDGGIYRAVVLGEKIKKIKKAALAKTSDESRKKYSPWMEWEDEMWEKTAIRALAQFAPNSADILEALADEDKTIGAVAVEEKNVTPVASETPTDLMEKLGLKKGTNLEVPEAKEESLGKEDNDSPFDEEDAK